MNENTLARRPIAAMLFQEEEMSSPDILIEIMREQLEAKVRDLQAKWYRAYLAKYICRDAVALCDQYRTQLYRAEDALWSLDDIAGQ